jgi:Tfp pilus assembly protein PilO
VSMRMRFTALILACVVVAAGWFMFVFRPAQADLGEVNDQVSQTVDQVAALQKKLAELQALKANEAEVRAEGQKMQAALPTDPKLADFIRLVQNAANEAGIDFVTVTPSLPAAPTSGSAPSSASTSATPPPAASSGDESQAVAPAPVSPVQAISVQVNAKGRFFEMENFILKMEHLARAMRIDDFSVTSEDSSGGGSPVLSTSMKMQIFMVNPQAAAPAATTTGSTAQETN